MGFAYLIERTGRPLEQAETEMDIPKASAESCASDNRAEGFMYLQASAKPTATTTETIAFAAS